MEDGLKISKGEYFRNCLLDHTQILSSDLGDQTKGFKYFRWRWPPMEGDLQILKVEHLSNHLLDHTQILNLSIDDQTIFL